MTRKLALGSMADSHGKGRFTAFRFDEGKEEQEISLVSHVVPSIVLLFRTIRRKENEKGISSCSNHLGSEHAGGMHTDDFCSHH